MTTIDSKTTGIPWIEKYRPEKLKDVFLPEMIMQQLNVILKTNQMQNLILTGSTGTGKTSSAICLSKEILKDYFEEGFKELNASDERGIKVVQGTMTQFCQKKLSDAECKKIILLDEADNMTDKQQRLISKMMEKHKASTAFIFTCNSSARIIEEIQSECSILRFTKIDQDSMRKILTTICKREKVEYDKDGLTMIIQTSGGDMRNAINNLHATFHGCGMVNAKNVSHICDRPEPEIIEKIIKGCLKKNLELVLKQIDVLRAKGYGTNDIVTGMLEYVKYGFETNVLEEKQKMNFLAHLSRTKIIMSNGIDAQLQLDACLLRIMKN